MRFVAYRLLKNSLQHTLFQIGEPVIKYKESGSIMDWIKYIKENYRVVKDNNVDPLSRTLEKKGG